MGVDIQWDRLAVPNTLGNVLNAYEAGSKAHDKTIVRNALSTYDTNPEGAISAMMPVDPQTALALRKMHKEDVLMQRRQGAMDQYTRGDTAGAQASAVAAGDFDLATAIGSLSKEQRDAAQRHAEDLAAFAVTLRGLPHDQAAARIQANRGRLIQQGFKPEEIDGFDPTPDNIEAVIGQAIDLKTALDQAWKAREADRQDKTLNESVRHNKATEATAQGQLGVARGNLGVRQQEFQERKRQGGFGTPGAGYFSPDLPPDAKLDP